MAKGRLFVISGPSGAGKGTICKEVLGSESNIKLSVSMTTRTPRHGERDKIDYYFTDRQDFERRIDEGGFMEYANVYGNFYGTPRKQVLDWVNSGTDVILEIDVQGAMQIKESYPDGVFIFILPPSMKELKRRISERGSETEETMARRMKAAAEEILLISEYDYSVVNDDLQQAAGCVKAIITANRCSIDHDEVESIVDRYKEEM